MVNPFFFFPFPSHVPFPFLFPSPCHVHDPSLETSCWKYKHFTKWYKITNWNNLFSCIPNKKFKKRIFISTYRLLLDLDLDRPSEPDLDLERRLLLSRLRDRLLRLLYILELFIDDGLLERLRSKLIISMEFDSGLQEHGTFCHKYYIIYTFVAI